MSSIDDISQRVRGVQEAVARLEERQRAEKANAERISADIGEIKDAIVALARLETASESCKDAQEMRWVVHQTVHNRQDTDFRELEHLVQSNRLQLAKASAIGGLVGMAGGVLITEVIRFFAGNLF